LIFFLNLLLVKHLILNSIMRIVNRAMQMIQLI
jgi:hypothetical protein